MQPPSNELKSPTLRKLGQGFTCPVHFPAVLKEWSNAQHMARQDLAVGENRGELNSREGDPGEEKNKVVIMSLSSCPWKCAIHLDNSAWACHEQHPQPWQPGTTSGHPCAGISFPSRLVWVYFPTPAPNSRPGHGLLIEVQELNQTQILAGVIYFFETKYCPFWLVVWEATAQPSSQWPQEL